MAASDSRPCCVKTLPFSSACARAAGWRGLCVIGRRILCALLGARGVEGRMRGGRAGPGDGFQLTYNWRRK